MSHPQAAQAPVQAVGRLPQPKRSVLKPIAMYGVLLCFGLATPYLMLKLASGGAKAVGATREASAQQVIAHEDMKRLAQGEQSRQEAARLEPAILPASVPITGSVVVGGRRGAGLGED